MLPCSVNTLETAKYHGLINDEELEGIKELTISVPLFNDNAFQIYRENNFNSLLSNVPDELVTDYADAVDSLWSLDSDDTLLISVETEPSINDLFTLIESYYVDKRFVLGKKLSEYNQLLTGINSRISFLEKKNRNEREELSYNYLKKEKVSVFVNVRNLEDRIDRVNNQINSLKKYSLMIEDYPDAALYIISSGRSPFSWERLNAGSCTCNINNSLVKRDYVSSHEESSVIHNLMSNPTTFYLFVELGGYERGYARGRVDCDDNGLRIVCEALHARPCKHSKRSVEITSLSELLLIGGLIKLGHLIDVNKISWGNVGIPREYGLGKKSLLINKVF